MFSEERQAKILELLNLNGKVVAKDLADTFQVSIDSIRRDLVAMEQSYLLRRTHGGAIPLLKSRQAPFPPSLRYGEGSEYQNAVAKLATSYIKEKDTVFLSGASIHYLMLKYIPQNMPLTMITNSHKVAEVLKERESIETYLVGGRIKTSGNITDSLANEFVRQFNIDLSFVTGGGLSATGGLSTATPEVASFMRSVVEVSRKNICLMNHQGFGVDFFAKVTPLSALDLIITDEETPSDEIEKVKTLGAEVVVASAFE